MEIQTSLAHPLVKDTKTRQSAIAVIIDVLRACTSICTALDNGAREVIPALEIEDAIRIAGKLDRDVCLIGGERNCRKPDGFDLGNSPQEYSSDVVAGKSIVMTTTNGMQGLARSRFADLRVLGCFVNLQAVVELIMTEWQTGAKHSVELICAGTDRGFAYEDALCAGAIGASLEQSRSDLQLCDATRATMELYRLHSDHLLSFIKTTEHARRLQAMGLEADVETAFDFNSRPLVPVFANSSIKSMSAGGN